MCCFICSFKLNQFAWVIWGGDLFFYREYRTSLKFRIYEYLRRITIKKFGYFFNNKEDYLLAQKVYSIKGVYFCAGYPQLNLKEGIVSHIGKINILLGNSADPTNNHIEALKSLSKFSKEKINIYVPLSYGGTTEYIKSVIECGRYYFGNQFIPLLDILSYKKYLEFLDSIAIMINNHNRQQALGNIGYLLSTGAKIFIKS
ncbi:MAG: TDP-N-acetylfucosamine:lipid II N-acetylfucosaminyltransferase, partial [Odoribacter sp.]